MSGLGKINGTLLGCTLLLALSTSGCDIFTAAGNSPLYGIDGEIVSDKKAKEYKKNRSWKDFFGHRSSGKTSSKDKTVFARGWNRNLAKSAEALGVTVDDDGFLRGPNVVHDLARGNETDYTTDSSYPGGTANVVGLHKTAGGGCQKNNTKAVNRMAHIYICKDGTIIQTKSLSRRSTRGEKGFNADTINIEFAAGYEKPYRRWNRKKKRYELACGAKCKAVCKARKELFEYNCYERITDKQKASSVALLAVISKSHGIPPKQMIDGVETEFEYMDKNGGIDTRNSAQVKNAYKNGGYFSSHQTKSADHHDDPIYFPNFIEVTSTVRAMLDRSI